MSQGCTTLPFPRAAALVLPLALTLLTLAGGCHSVGPPIRVRVENHLTSPPQALTLVSEDHPAYASAADYPPLTKPAPTDVLEKVVELAEDQGFSRWATDEPAWSDQVEPLPVLRRLGVEVGGHTRSLLVPRQPPADLADCFNQVSRTVAALFNEIEFHRPDAAEVQRLGQPLPENPLEAEQERLEQRNVQKRRDNDR